MLEPKTITILTGFYFPEDTAIGLYTTQFAKHLTKKGHVVKVITGFPNYPQWEIHDNYKNLSNYYSETIDGIEIIRYKQFVTTAVSFKNRVLMMLSLFYGTCINSRKINNTDVVICIVPFTISILPALFLSKIKKAKLWVHVQDFEFDLALESGILKKDNFVINFVKKSIFLLETILLNQANIVSSISHNMLQKIKSKSKHQLPYFFPNWVSANAINPTQSNQHQYINSNKFTLLYSGNIGEKQDWTFFIEFCNLIQNDTIDIVIVGNGAYADNLKRMVKKFNFVKVFDAIPYNDLNDLLCSANAHFLFQKQDVVDTVMPSKILGMMASAKPSIVVGNIDSEVKKIVNQSGGGYYYADYKPELVYQTINHLKSNDDIAFQMGLKAREFILQNFAEDKILEDFCSKINSI